jgi:very-short-patch-repair endonuclease
LTPRRTKTTRAKLPAPDREAEFRRVWSLLTAGRDVPPLESQIPFHPSRRYRLDFGFPEYRVGVEINGGIFSRRGGHSSVSGLLRDYEKARECVLQGWAVLPFDTKTLAARPGYCVDQILELLALRGWEDAT